MKHVLNHKIETKAPIELEGVLKSILEERNLIKYCEVSHTHVTSYRDGNYGYLMIYTTLNPSGVIELIKLLDNEGFFYERVLQEKYSAVFDEVQKARDEYKQAFSWVR